MTAERIRRVEKSEHGWAIVLAITDSFWSEDEEVQKYQDSLNWRLVAVDKKYYYLEKMR